MSLLFMALATKLDRLSDLRTNMTEGENHLSKVIILWSTFALFPILVSTCNKANEGKPLENKLGAEAHPPKGSGALKLRCGIVTVVPPQVGHRCHLHGRDFRVNGRTSVLANTASLASRGVTAALRLLLTLSLHQENIFIPKQQRKTAAQPCLTYQ